MVALISRDVEGSRDGYDGKVKAAMAAMRRMARMTQEEFAEALSAEVGDGRQIRGHWISRWESGSYMPKSDIFMASMAISGAEPVEIGVDPRAAIAIRVNDLERQLKEERKRREGQRSLPIRLELPQATGPEGDYLTVEESAGMLGRKGRSMYNLIRRGDIAGYRFGTRTMFLRKDVESLAKGLRPK